MNSTNPTWWMERAAWARERLATTEDPESQKELRLIWWQAERKALALKVGEYGWALTPGGWVNARRDGGEVVARLEDVALIEIERLNAV